MGRSRNQHRSTHHYTCTCSCRYDENTHHDCCTTAPGSRLCLYCNLPPPTQHCKCICSALPLHQRLALNTRRCRSTRHLCTGQVRCRTYECCIGHQNRRNWPHLALRPAMLLYPRRTGGTGLLGSFCCSTRTRCTGSNPSTLACIVCI